MATQAIPGFKGSLSISVDEGNTYQMIAEMREATLTISQEELEASSFSSNGWMEYIPGLKEWELEAEGIYLLADAGQDQLYSALVQGETVMVRLFPSDESGNEGYEGQAFITSWEVSNAADDVVSISATFRGSGALGQVTAA
ncbi:phage tail tube protein [Desmospora profundinema]|uniref:TP901-1 family phage major tail protein n=1 Tax=Desmospora profundinema TaxID=1571184 RepID=A0ABU1IKZ8_9BACL|nr:phage tail tube protein [Desmospora profundinema]MDR6225448.1 TP901-1 family phage major tail protein [Desmospora profundinema]